MQIAMVEAPGGFGDAYQCPTCSRMYSALVEENGVLTDQKADPPRVCRRCGSPMDLDKSLAFQDKMAADAGLAPTAARGRRTVTV